MDDDDYCPKHLLHISGELAHRDQKIDALEIEVERLNARVSDLQQLRDEEYQRMLEWRHIDVEGLNEKPCAKCQGSGVVVYGSTSTWRGGGGGMAITCDVCNDCWGSGVAERPWVNLRKLEARDDA